MFLSSLCLNRSSIACLALFVTAIQQGCCCSAVAPNANTNANSDWHEFTSVDGNFRADFPEAPDHTMSADGLEHRYTTQESEANPTITPVEKLEFVVDEIADAGATVRPLEVSGYAGAEARYTLPEGGTNMFVRHRIYHAGGTAYQVMVVQAGGERSIVQADRFFNSFELIEIPAQ